MSVRYLVGRYRLWWGWCPACNSDAPAKDVCGVCRQGLMFRDANGQSDDGYTLAPWLPSSELKSVWWDRFVNAREATP